MPDPTTPNKGYTEPTVGGDVGSWGNVLNADLVIVDSNLGSNLPLAITSADITLTGVQAQNLSYTLTGVLTGNRSLIFPAAQGGFFKINNGCTGAFTVTAKVSGGTGVVIPQGGTAAVWSDATNMLFDDSSVYVGSNLPVTITSADVTLNAGQALNLSYTLTGILTGNRALIFPAGQGGFFKISNATTGLFTITAKVSGGTGAIIPQGVTAAVWSDGVNMLYDDSGIYVYQNFQGGYINKFRNGTFDIFQRGTTAMTATTAGAYTADGWIVVPTGASVTAAAASGRQLTPFSLQVVGASSVTDVIVKQRIESSIAAPLTSQVVTIQIWVFNATGGPITPLLTVKHPTVADNYASTVTDVSAVSLQVCTLSAWSRMAYTFTASASSALGMEVSFDFGNNFSSNAKSIQLAEADIRVTPSAPAGLSTSPSPPELRPIGSELALCQRYFQKTFAQGTSPANNVGVGTGEQLYLATVAGAASNKSATVPFIVTMMSAPSITFYNPAANNSQARDETASADCSATTAAVVSDRQFRISATGAAGSAAVNNIAVHWTASAEI